VDKLRGGLWLWAGDVTRSMKPIRESGAAPSGLPGMSCMGASPRLTEPRPRTAREPARLLASSREWVAWGLNKAFILSNAVRESSLSWWRLR